MNDRLNSGESPTENFVVKPENRSSTQTTPDRPSNEWEAFVNTSFKQLLENSFKLMKDDLDQIKKIVGSKLEPKEKIDARLNELINLTPLSQKETENFKPVPLVNFVESVATQALNNPLVSNILISVNRPDSFDKLKIVNRQTILAISGTTQVLVDNAIQAISNQTDGEIKITISETPEGYQISVQDNGPGISDEVLKRLRSGEKITTKQGGTGAGLDTTRKIFGAGLEFFNEVDGGTIVSFIVPSEYIR